MTIYTIEGGGYMEFSDRFKNLRKDRKLSQEQLSVELHVSRQAISKWETGVLPDVENLINIAKFFNCSLDYLVGIEDVKLKEMDVSYEKHFKKIESMSLYISIACIIGLLILWVSSKFVEVNFIRQDLNGKWYTGFRAFAEQYRLYPIIYILTILCLIFLTLKCVMNVINNRKNKKYLIFRVLSWMMYISAFFYFIVDFVDINKFFVINNQTIVFLTIYIIIIVLLNLGMYCYERRE